MKMNIGTLLAAMGLLRLSGVRWILLCLARVNPSRLWGLRATRPMPIDLREAFTARSRMSPLSPRVVCKASSCLFVGVLAADRQLLQASAPAPMGIADLAPAPAAGGPRTAHFYYQNILLIHTYRGSTHLDPVTPYCGRPKDVDHSVCRILLTQQSTTVTGPTSLRLVTKCTSRYTGVPAVQHP